MPPPSLDQNFCLAQRIKYLAIEKLITQLAVEALAKAIFPGTAWRNVGGLRADIGDPPAQGRSDERGAIVRTDIGRRAVCDHHIR